MISITKIFHFETGHAIHNYDGACAAIHGHSYELHVTVRAAEGGEDALVPPGFVLDFKDLKKIVKEHIISRFDHKLVLSREYIRSMEAGSFFKNVFELDREPTAENILLFIKEELNRSLPEPIILQALKLFETNSSYAEWVRE